MYGMTSIKFPSLEKVHTLTLIILAHQITHTHFKSFLLKVLLQLKNKGFITAYCYEPEERDSQSPSSAQSLFSKSSCFQ